MKNIMNSAQQDSLTANNIGFTLAFEKWLGINDFSNSIHP